MTPNCIGGKIVERASVPTNEALSAHYYGCGVVLRFYAMAIYKNTGCSQCLLAEGTPGDNPCLPPRRQFSPLIHATV
jgi:hypothetical protein